MDDKINLLLDLDNTLICAEPYEDLTKEEINRYKRKFLNIIIWMIIT